MAKSVEITFANGQRVVYESTLFKGYHVKHADDGFCVVEKKIFEEPKVVACYSTKSSTISQERCGICELVNPTQKL